MEAFVVIARHENALIVPRSAVVDRKVLVIEGSSAVLRPVEIGFTSIHEVEIVAGLKEGERVVVENLDDLRSGTRVRVRGGAGGGRRPAARQHTSARSPHRGGMRVLG